MSTLLSMDPLVTLGEMIKLMMALPYTIPTALPKLRVCIIVFLDGE